MYCFIQQTYIAKKVQEKDAIQLTLYSTEHVQGYQKKKRKKKKQINRARCN